MMMDKFFKSFTTTILIQCCIIFGHHTITSSISSSNGGRTSRYPTSNNTTINHSSGHDDGHHSEQPAHFTQQWAVHIRGGHEAANQLASKHGFENTGQILPDYYHFVHRKVAKRSTEPSHEYHQALSSEPEVRWHAQQIVKRRSKRDFLQLSGSKPSSTSLTSNNGGFNNRNRNLKSTSRANIVTFNDPRWPAMWYLNRGNGLDMNVQEAWAEGITGKGIVVTILDDGLEKDHPDIQQNYDPLASFDVNSLDNDPMPTYDLTDSNRHGTRCAGEVAAEANNSMCAVGVAYEASVGGVRMLDGDVTDAVEARSLSHNPQHIDIYSASWGPDDDGKTVDGPGELATRAFQEGITKGRHGKGSIFVWASGNGGRDHDNCNCDGYTNSIWTLSISSATENGLVPWYSEACSSTLATTYSSGGTGEKQIVTIDLHHSCTSSHTGTSASAPLAAGICALALQANTNLTWRDMQHIVVRTARPANLIAPDWTTNGVGRNVSHSFGYGLMDAGAMVKLARNWKTVPEQNKCEVRAPYTDKNIPAKSKVTLDLKVTECPGVNLLEHVQAQVTLTSGRRGDLQVYLVSPRGTRSVLLAHRRHDLNRSGFTDWPFMSVHNWGESPLGKWTLEIHNEGRYAGKLQTWTFIGHGTSSNPNDPTTPAETEPKKDSQTSGGGMVYDGSENKIVMEPSQGQSNHQPIAIPSAPELPADISSPPASSSAAASSLQYPGCIKMSMSMSSPGKCLECAAGLYLQDSQCISSCFHNYYPEKIPASYGSNARICLPCHYTCFSCFGSNESQCVSCFKDSTLRTTIRTVMSPEEVIENYDNNGIPFKNHKQNSIQTTYKESHCYPTALLSTIDGNELWYKALLMGVIVNVTIIIFLLFYIWIQRQREGRGSNANDFIGEINVDGEEDSSSISNNWLSLNRKAYSRVSPEDEDNHIMIAQNNRNSTNDDKNVEGLENNINVGFKIAIPLNNSHSSSKRYDNNTSHLKMKAAADEERLRVPIPLNHLNFTKPDTTSQT